MSVKTKTFDLFGVQYRTKQFTAIRALELMKAPDILPLDTLSNTQARHDAGHEWIDLDGRAAINRMVIDRIDVMCPTVVLHLLCKVVGEYSFGFTTSFKSVKVPSRFQSDSYTPRSSEHVDPVVAALLEAETATLRELEEYYSLEDAFKMFDVLVANGVNKALAHEAAMKEAKSRR
jgi:hypothetical protein